ncbi:MAG: sugar phosphate isomerase/epimerase [Planctomyces sp.]|nr:sugar phosphate isomerase/epimerase [Planctomyces sp.]
MSRREYLQIAGVFGAAALLGTTMSTTLSGQDATPKPDAARFRLCLNTSTIRGQELPLEQEIEIASNAGFTGIEPWISEIENAVGRGISLAELRTRINDAGLTVEGAIGFARWIVNDDIERQRGLDEMKKDMDLVRELGGTRIAAPPAGMQDEGSSPLDLLEAADRYRAILELGDETGVTPMIEVWGFSKNVARLGEAALIAIESQHPKACILTDVYHLHKGGSDARSLKLLSGPALPVMHFNDYPGEKTRTELNDSDRVYPGDGIAPLTEILHILRDIGFDGALSLELFNKSYWKDDASTVAKTGIAKMKQAIAAAFPG